MNAYLTRITTAGIVLAVMSVFASCKFNIVIPPELLGPFTATEEEVVDDSSLEADAYQDSMKTESIKESDGSTIEVKVFTSAAALKGYLNDQVENDVSNPYVVKLTGLDISTKALGDIFKAATRYIALDLSECSGDFLSAYSGKEMLKGNIVSILLPATVKKINRNTFSTCSSLTVIEAPGVETIGSGAFKNCEKLQYVVLPELTAIESGTDNRVGAFVNCISLGDFTFVAPKLKDIGAFTFYGCTGFKNAVFFSVKTIGNSAFKDCDLQTLFVPVVQSIGNNAFQGNTNLAAITFGEEPPALANKDVFSGCEQLTAIFVPSGAVDSYKNTTKAHWNDSLKQKVQSL